MTKLVAVQDREKTDELEVVDPKVICGKCRKEMKIEEWAKDPLVTDQEKKKGIKLPDPDKSHKCSNCGFVWERSEHPLKLEKGVLVWG